MTAENAFGAQVNKLICVRFVHGLFITLLREVEQLDLEEHSPLQANSPHIVHKEHESILSHPIGPTATTKHQRIIEVIVSGVLVLLAPLSVNGKVRLLTSSGPGKIIQSSLFTSYMVLYPCSYA